MAVETETATDDAAVESRWELTGPSTATLIGGWGLAALATLLVGEIAGARFLDLPLGAYVAGQGALVSLVVVGVRIARAEEER
jgi:uncharacterized membrane protein